MKLHLLSILSLIFLFTSCQKNSDKFEPYPLDGSTHFIYEELGIESTSELISSNEESTLDFKHARVNIPEGSITTFSDSKIMMHFTETKNALDIYLSEISTSIGESFLMPSYYFDISLSNEAQINEDQPMTIFVEVESLKGLDLFQYNAQTMNWEESFNAFEIQESVNEAGVLIYGALISINRTGIYSLGSKVNFINTDVRDICISLPGEYNSTNSIVFVKLKDNLVVPLERTADLGTFCRLNQFPTDNKMTLVAITNIRVNQFEIFIEEIKEDTENVNLDGVLLPSDLENIKEILKDI